MCSRCDRTKPYLPRWRTDLASIATQHAALLDALLGRVHGAATGLNGSLRDCETLFNDREATPDPALQRMESHVPRMLGTDERRKACHPLALLVTNINALARESHCASHRLSAGPTALSNLCNDRVQR